MNNANAGSRLCVRGFTLVEILVAIGVIVILMALVITVGARVVGGQKVSQTTGILSTLDRALEEYFVDAQSFPKFSLQAHKNIQGSSITDPIELQTYLDPNIRSYDDGEEYPTRPTAAVFIEQVRGFGAVDSIIESLPSQFMRAMKRHPSVEEDPDGGYVRVADAWDREILFVHPDNALAQALYGTCSNRRPYFVSAGDDMGFGFSSEVSEGLPDQQKFEATIELIGDNQMSTPVTQPLQDIADPRTRTIYDEYRDDAL